MKPPEYVKSKEGGIVLRLITDGEKQVYFRDAGQWSTEFKIENGQIITKSPDKLINNIVLVPCTHEDWAYDNWGYV